ncbi:recombinase family protein [Labrenzia sp. CP4]|jgi:hypothetical protein|uniref:recombinase family protein n=1 Tax=Labrenzia sp. CP4 TaxID=1674922 RepID=UPI000784F804|nr:recombinase family protein [Labrenzia sp. CP4]
MEAETRTFAYTLVTDGREQAQERAALIRRNVDYLFQDWMAKPKKRRPQFERMKLHLQPGDTLIVWKLDRLGSDDAEMLSFLEWLRSRQVTLECLSQAGTLTDFIVKLRQSLCLSDPLAGNDGHVLRHLCELETQAEKLANDIQSLDTDAAATADSVKALAGDVRKHLSFIAWQIRFGEYSSALGRIDEIVSDF